MWFLNDIIKDALTKNDRMYIPVYYSCAKFIRDVFEFRFMK